MGKKAGARPHLPKDDRGPAAGGGVGRLLERHGISAAKGLGQHFLVSSSVVSAIVARVGAGVSVLEIGPGAGALTGPLVERGHKLVAVEADRRMQGPLEEVAPGAEVVYADALRTDLAGILGRLPEPRAVVSNMPYNITGPLLARVSECAPLIAKAVLMMQKEVGEKVVAKAGGSERGALSVAMQLRFEVKKVCDAKASAFRPPPKVDSIVLEFVPRAPRASLDAVTALVHVGFAQPRKTLLNNLSKTDEKGRVARAIGALKAAPNVRPHQLTNEQWLELATLL